MHHPEIRKYQLFPKDKKLPQLSPGKALDPEQAFAVAMGQTSEKTDKTSSTSNGLRLRIKEHNLTRRRKVSVPELGPMTTVQEAAMDSRMLSAILCSGPYWRLTRSHSYYPGAATASRALDKCSRPRLEGSPALGHHALSEPNHSERASRDHGHVTTSRATVSATRSPTAASVPQAAGPSRHSCT